MRIRAMLLMGCAIWLSAPAWSADQVQYASAPSWVRPVAPPVNDDTMAEAPAKTLLQSHQIRFTATGSTVYVESFVRVQTPQGLRSLGNIGFPWKPDSDVLTVHKFHLLRGEQVIDILANGQTFEVLRRENNLEYSALDGVLTATIQPIGIEVGDVINVAFSLQRESRLMPVPEVVATGFNLFPLARVELRASWDKGMPIRWRATEEVKGIKEIRTGNQVELAWTATNLGPIDQPRDVPLRFWREARIDFSGFQSWNEVSKKLAPLYARASKLEPDSPLHAEAKQIAAASPDTEARLEAALKLAQDRVRYVFLGMNEGGLDPANADLTWQRRFGDCKGKSALIIALLKEMGIESEAVAVNTQGGNAIADRLPMLGSFDHVIVRARQNGKTWWLDGALSGAWRRADMVTPGYHWGLPISARGETLVRMDAAPAAEPQVETNTEIDARAGLHTDAPFRVEMRFRGPAGAALHMQLSGMTPADRDRALRDYFKKLYDFVEIKSVAAAFDESSGIEKLTMEGTAEMDWGGSSYTTDGLSVGYHADFDRKQGVNLDAPFVVDHPSYVINTQRVELPERGSFTTRGKDYETVLAGTRFERRSKIDGRVFTGTAITRSVAAEIPATEARTAQQQLNDMARDRLEIVYTGYRVTDADVAALRTRKIDDAPNLIWRGNILLDRGDYSAALADFEKAVKLDDKNYRALAHRGLARYWRRDLELAAADFETVLAQEPNNAIALRGSGAVFQMQEKFPESIARLTDSLRLEPGNTFTLSHRAYAYMKSDQTDEALADAAAALKQDSGYVDMYAIRAHMLIKKDDKQGALREMESMLAANPSSRNALATATAFYGQYGMRQEAIAVADRAIALDPDAMAYFNRAAARERKDFAGRRADLDAALAKDPKFMPAIEMLALVQIDSGDYASAIASYTRRLEAQQDPYTKFWLRTKRGVAYAKSGQAALARKEFAALLAEDPESNLYNNFCWELAVARVNLELALTACERAVKRYPKIAAYQDSLGMVNLQLGRFDASIAAYDAALAIRPTHDTSLYGRGLAKKLRCNCEAGDADLAAGKHSSLSALNEFDRLGPRQ